MKSKRWQVRRKGPGTKPALRNQAAQMTVSRIRICYRQRIAKNASSTLLARMYRIWWEPVREWLKGLSEDDRKRIGADIKTVEFGWPIGMPVCKPLRDGVYEVRTSLAQNRIARVLFYIDKKGRMILLHGFIKKTQKTPPEDLDLARHNKSKHQAGLK